MLGTGRTGDHRTGRHPPDDAILALLPFIAPEIIKLDLRLIQDRPGRDIARWVSAALAETERSGATLLAEGIETEEHLGKARAIGARLGQGFYLGHPGPAEDAVAGRTGGAWRTPRPSVAATGVQAGSPYDTVVAHRPARPCSKPMLIALSHHVENMVENFTSPGMIFAAFQDRARFTAQTAARYERFARSCSLTAAFGLGLDDTPAPGVRGASIDADDVLCSEWSVLVLGVYEAAALVARDLGDDGRDDERRFTYAVTHDRNLVISAARTLLLRL